MAPRPPLPARSAGRRALAGRRAAAGLVLFGLLGAGCARPPTALGEAKKQEAAGRLDVALGTLQAVRLGAPGSPDDEEAGRLATGWLLAAAAREAAPDERKRRLEAALAWSPASGEAQARLCGLLIDEGHDADAERCLGEGMAGKTGAPEAVVAEARRRLDTRREQVGAGERGALLAAGRPAQLQALIDRWPGSPEAAQARQMLARASSLCGDPSASLVEVEAQIAGLERLAGEQADAARATAELAARLAAYEHLGKEASALAGALRDRAASAEGHAIQPGEEKLRKALHDAFARLGDLASDLGDELRRADVENEASYDEHSSRALAAWGRSLKQAAARLRKDLARPDLACKAAGAP